MLIAEDGTADFHVLRAILHRLGIVAKIIVIIGNITKDICVIFIFLVIKIVITFFGLFKQTDRLLVILLLSGGDSFIQPFINLFLCLRLN